MDYTAEQLEALYDLLPEELNEVMYGDERDRVVRHLSSRYKLSNEQKEGLDIALDDVILGIAPFEALQKELVGYLDVSPSIATNIAQDLNDFLLADVKSSIGEMAKKKEGFDASLKKTGRGEEGKGAEVRVEKLEVGRGKWETTNPLVSIPVKHEGGGQKAESGSQKVEDDREKSEAGKQNIETTQKITPVPTAAEPARQDNSTIGKVRSIGNRFGLQLDQIAVLVKEIDDVLNKLTTPTSFPEKIIARLPLSPEDGRRLAEELNNAIFIPRRISVLPPKVVVEEEKPRVVSLDEGVGGTESGPWPEEFRQFLGGKEKEFEKLGERLRIEKVNREYEVATATDAAAPPPIIGEPIVGATGFENKTEVVADLAPSEELATPPKPPAPARYEIDPYREPAE